MPTTLTTIPQFPAELHTVPVQRDAAAATLRADALLARAGAGNALLSDNSVRGRWYRDLEDSLAQWLAEGGFGRP